MSSCSVSYLIYIYLCTFPSPPTWIPSSRRSTKAFLFSFFKLVFLKYLQCYGFNFFVCFPQVFKLNQITIYLYL